MVRGEKTEWQMSELREPSFTVEASRGLLVLEVAALVIWGVKWERSGARGSEGVWD